MKRRHILGGTIVAMLIIAGSWVMAASFAIQNGTTETGSGAYHGTAAIAYWTETAVGVGTQPGVLPAVLSGTAGTPTVLAGAATNYAVNAPTLNDIAHFWKFSEATTAPINTEVELQLTISTGAVPVITAVIVYVETQAVAPGSAITFTLYYDLGSPSSGTITLNAVTQISQQCAAVGTCP
ncbi:MAG: hypothetical protein L3K10_08395 [Thermoplasmata archaeon]|nr:hypothetical protein [Thermoplasmata archaeon]